MKKSRKKGPSSKIVFSLASKLSTFLQITEMTLETFQTTNFILFVEFSLTTLKWEKLPVRCLDVGETLPSIVVKADTGCTELVEVFVKGLESVDPVPNFKHVYFKPENSNLKKQIQWRGPNFSICLPTLWEILESNCRLYFDNLFSSYIV